MVYDEYYYGVSDDEKYSELDKEGFAKKWKKRSIIKKLNICNIETLQQLANKKGLNNIKNFHKNESIDILKPLIKAKDFKYFDINTL